MGKNSKKLGSERVCSTGSLRCLTRICHMAYTRKECDRIQCQGAYHSKAVAEAALYLLMAQKPQAHHKCGYTTYDREDTVSHKA